MGEDQHGTSTAGSTSSPKAERDAAEEVPPPIEISPLTRSRPVLFSDLPWLVSSREVFASAAAAGDDNGEEKEDGGEEHDAESGTNTNLVFPIDFRERPVRQSCCDSFHFNNTLSPEGQPTGLKVDIHLHDLGEMTLIGKGASCEVFSCVYKGKSAAVKIRRRDLCSRLLLAVEWGLVEEIGLLAQLQTHPHIVQLFGAGLSKSRGPFIVMERLFMSLKRVTVHDEKNHRDTGWSFWRNRMLYPLKRTFLPRAKLKHPSTKRRLLWMQQAAEVSGIVLVLALYSGTVRLRYYYSLLMQALAYAHRGLPGGNVMLHRDIKPSNLGISYDGNLKLMDFGLARVIESASGGLGEVYDMSGCTGSLRYMAPEVALCQRYNETLDVYSWAMVTVELLSRSSPPYRGYTTDEFFSYVVRGSKRPTLPAEFPVELRNLLNDCWQTTIQARPSMSDVTHRIQAVPNFRLMRE
jgi:serine/threonine protein kinase